MLTGIHGALDRYQNRLPELDRKVVIGISVAIAGNILISLALNIQKLAHKRLDVQRSRSNTANQTRRNTPSLDEREEDNNNSNSNISASNIADGIESRPLLELTSVSYGSASRSEPNLGAIQNQKRSVVSRLWPRFSARKKTDFEDQVTDGSDLIPVDIIAQQDQAETLSKATGEAKAEDNKEAEYLRSKLWWVGFSLMNIGEVGNFISYAWAPASVVAPLGTFALVANCFFAPLMLNERFRKRDLFGILIAIIGAVTVVLASNASDVRLDPEGLLHALGRTSFLVYSVIYIVLGIILGFLSHGPLGDKVVFIDVGLCAIFGGFTVLSTKAISTLLTMNWLGIFASPITYPVLAVLIFTGVGQIRYLNRALMKFDSKTVVPVQFVLFNLSAIIGSAVLYGDFERASFHQMVTFLYGCAATFAGVFLIAWEPKKDTIEPDEDMSDDVQSLNTRPSSLHSHSGSPINTGSLARRRRATLVFPGEMPQQLRHKRSGVMGLSPAQPLLLVHTPPLMTRDLERDAASSPGGSYDSTHRRRRAQSWFGEGNRATVSTPGTVLPSSRPTS